ncbi:MAG: hypothetical protein KGO05_00575, partial [Chloroflexota bacterium]|nr:hypothetical protein [Chloroflexota bacterium]
MSATERATRTNTTLQLTVVEGLSAPRGAAYISPAALDALECQPGDVILIQSARGTVARVYVTPPEGAPDAPVSADGEIQMEGLVRQNAGAALGELVSVRSVTPQPAVSVALTPATGAASVSDAEMQHVARALKGLAVV